MGAFKCPKCRKTTGGNETFCTECGQPLDIVCPACGEIWRYMFEYQFCPVCGRNMEHVDAKKQLLEIQSTQVHDFQREKQQRSRANKE
ncbi:MAG: hypothetical protein HGA97_07870 [Chlorobiaceae bacterium]|nr:hypothetical protein [Chlorobiaceae bacterium]